MGGETALYVWGSYFMVLAMIATEFVLLLLREHAIRGQFDPIDDAPGTPDDQGRDPPLPPA